MLNHIDKKNRPTMVDIASKEASQRKATASAKVIFSQEIKERFKKFKVFLILSFSILLFSCGGGGGNTPAPSPNPQTSNSSFSWEVVSPESQGLSAEKVTAAMNFAMNDGQYSQAVLIIKNGKIVAIDKKPMEKIENVIFFKSIN